MNPPIRVVTFGARHELGQINRIDAGLIAAGATVISPDEQPYADLVYANDEPRWAEAIEYRDTKAPAAKLILCCLDVPEICFPAFKPTDLYERLVKADRVVSISRYVQSQLVRYFSLASDIIYQPIKDISPAKRVSGERPYPYRALMCGRLQDPGKRASLMIQALQVAGFTEAEVAVIGGEPTGWGTYLGVVTDEVLNDLYNSVDYVMIGSVFEGLCLPLLESVAAGAIPILCHDMPTAAELCPAHWLCFPHPMSIAYRLATLSSTPEWMAAEKALSLQIGANVRRDFSGHEVAERILSVYRSLINPNLQ